MTFKQTLSLFGPANFSQWQHLTLWCKGFNSTKVGAILDGLEHATELQTVVLDKASVMNEQIEWIKARESLSDRLGNNGSRGSMAIDQMRSCQSFHGLYHAWRREKRFGFTSGTCLIDPFLAVTRPMTIPHSSSLTSSFSTV